MRLTTSCRRFDDHLQTTEVCGESKAIIGRPIAQGIAVIRGAVGWATPTRECRLQLGRITAYCGQVCPEGRCLYIYYRKTVSTPTVYSSNVHCRKDQVDSSTVFHPISRTSQEGDRLIQAGDSCGNDPVQKVLHVEIEQATIDAAERRW